VQRKLEERFLKDGRLYRETHKTFEEYCKEKWEIKRQRAYELIDAAKVAENLSEISDKIPSRESHTAPLFHLEPEQQKKAWQKARRGGTGQMQYSKQKFSA
jgi:hypothetical protein